MPDGGVPEPPHEEDFGDTPVAAPTRSRLLALTNESDAGAPARKVQRRHSRSDVVSVASADDSQVSLVIISASHSPCVSSFCAGEGFRVCVCG